MKRLHKTFGVVVGSALAAMSLASCGDNGVNCGEGTVEEDGSCVPSGGSAVCTGSTVLDPATGTCVIDPRACKDGTVLVDGSCQDAGVVKPDATESAEPNDPKDINDTSPDPAPNAGTIAVPAIGAKGFVIKGCITPYRDVRDTDTQGNPGDGILDPDLDSWIVTVTQPTLLDVNADGVRGLVAGFALLSENDEELNGLQYVRQAISLTNDRAVREVYLPKAGTYRLNMADSRTLLNSIAGPGDANTCYYATVTQKALPTAKPLALQPIESTYEGKAELYSYTPTEGEVFTVNAIPESANNQAGLTVIRNDAFSRLSNGTGQDPTAFAFITNMKASDTIKVVYDPALVYSGAPVGVTLIAQPILATALPTNGALPLVNRIPNQGQQVGAFDLNWTYMDVATANELKHIKIDGANGVKFNWSIIDAETLAPVATGTTAGLDPAGLARAPSALVADADWFRFASAGRYYVLFYSPGTPGNYSINAVQTVGTVGTFAVGTPSDGIMLGSATRNSAFGEITSNENWIVNSGSSATFTGSLLVRRYLKTATGRFDRDFRAASVQLVRKDGTSAIGEVVSPGFDAQIVRVSDTGTPATDTSVFNLNLTRRDYTDLDTVVEGTPVVSAATAIGAGAVKRYFVKAKKGSQVNLSVTPAGAANLKVDVLFSNETIEDTFGPAGANNPVNFGLLSENGWIALRVTNNGGAGTVAINMNAKTPADFVDACTGGAVLTQIPDAAGFGSLGDEALTPAQTLPFNFSLFGQNVTNFKVSTNGWLSFAPGLPNDALYVIAEFNDESPLAGAIAPYWTDLTNIVICKKEEANRVTIQWTGNTFGSIFAPAVLVQTQAVIYKDQPRVDFLYGAADKHANTGEDASIGTNSLDKLNSFILGFQAPVVPAGTAVIVSTEID